MLKKMLNLFILLSKFTGLTILICWGLLLGMFVLGNQINQYDNSRLEKEYYKLSIDLMKRELQFYNDYGTEEPNL